MREAYGELKKVLDQLELTTLQKMSVYRVIDAYIAAEREQIRNLELTKMLIATATDIFCERRTYRGVSTKDQIREAVGEALLILEGCDEVSKEIMRVARKNSQNEKF